MHEEREERVLEEDYNASELEEERVREEESVRDEKVNDRRDREDRGEDAYIISFLNDGEVEEIKSRWSKIQTQFVDEPRTSVDRAEALIQDVMERFMQKFANERDMLDSSAASGEEISTEDLRVALKRYRALLQRLLSLKGV